MLRTLLLASLALAGCYHPTFDDGAFHCGPSMLCPPGLSCGADQLCHTADGAPGPFAGNGMLGPLDLTGMSGMVVLDTENGQISAGGTVLVAANSPGFQNVPQGGSAPAVGLFNFSTLVVPSSVTLKPSTSSNSVLALAASDTLTINGTIDWSGFGVSLGGAAGGAGTDPQSVGGAGAAGAGTAGGGGGGHHDAGTTGTSSGGAGGQAYGNDDLTPVYTGSGGGGGGTTRGGNSGGAVVLLGATVVMGGTIDVRGIAGDPASGTSAGGGGGGSGGAVLISGGTVTLNPGHDLILTGGKGGAGRDAGGSPVPISGGDGSAGRALVAADVLKFGSGTTTVTSQPPFATVVQQGPSSAPRRFPR
jgi:hypothetical protein